MVTASAEVLQASGVPVNTNSLLSNALGVITGPSKNAACSKPCRSHESEWTMHCQQRSICNLLLAAEHMPKPYTPTKMPMRMQSNVMLSCPNCCSRTAPGA